MESHAPQPINQSMALGSRLCRVCGGLSTGLHFGAVICDDCKTFFKRNLAKHAGLHCYVGGICHINLETRNRCKACRWKKCLAQGMVVQETRPQRIPKDRTTAGHFGSGNFANTRTAPRASGLTAITRHVPSGLFSENSVFPTHPPETPYTTAETGPLEVESLSSTLASLNHRLHRLRISSSQPVPQTALISTSSPSHTFADANLAFMLTDFLGDFIRPCRLPGEVSLYSASSHLRCSVEPGAESPMLRYYNIMQSRCGVLEESIKSVSDALLLAYGEEMAAVLEGLEKWYTRGLVQYEPVCTLRQMVRYAEHCAVTNLQMMTRFAQFVPGFAELNGNDQRTLVRDRSYTSFQIPFHCVYRDNECYYAIGPDRVQYSRYWLSQMISPHFLAHFFAMAAKLNDLQLNLTEIGLLLAVSLFKTDVRHEIEDKKLVDFLYCHYLDALIHLVRYRPSDFLDKLYAVIKQISVMNELHRRCILGFDMEQAFVNRMGDLPDIAAVVQMDPDQFARPDFQPAQF